jgi:hypothetical protein
MVMLASAATASARAGPASTAAPISYLSSPALIAGISASTAPARSPQRR